MRMLDDLKMYWRFGWGLWGFLRHTISLEDAEAIVKQRLAKREANFLRLVERGIFGYSRSPYLPLLKLAGCEMGDIRHLVRDQGVEGTLMTLREAGVYITFEEFKGWQPVVRQGKVMHVRLKDFDNPYTKRQYWFESGGTTGAGTRIENELDHLAAQAAPMMLTRHLHNALEVPMAVWRGILPDGSGINNVLRAAHFGRAPEKWFTPYSDQDLRPALRYRIGTRFPVIMGRLYGVALPWPEKVSMDQAIVVARWAAEMLKTRGACLVSAPVSRALRVCLAAWDAGLDLTGAIFMVAGEPPTPAKVKGITRTGARYFPTYGFAEAGRVGMGCGQPVECNDVHLLRDAFAIIQYPRQVPGMEIEVHAFNVTSLLPTAPKLLLNVEIDDYGVKETRSCGCRLEALGYTEHLRGVHSFRKLTGEGVTLVGSEMLHILEELLPTRFGGSPLDYQLLEEEDEQGFTRLSLVVSPNIPIADETVVIRTVMNALRNGTIMADSAREIWNQAGALRIKRMEPVRTRHGKLIPLHLAQRSDHSS